MVFEEEGERKEKRETHLLPELGVLIETELGVHAQNSSTLNLRQGVDLDLCRVLLLEELVELLEDVGGSLPRFGLEAELLSGLESELGGETLLEGNGDGDDGGGVVAGNVLDAARGSSQYCDVDEGTARQAYFIPPWREATRAGPPRPRSLRIAT